MGQGASDLKGINEITAMGHLTLHDHVDICKHGLEFLDGEINVGGLRDVLIGGTDCADAIIGLDLEI